MGLKRAAIIIGSISFTALGLGLVENFYFLPREPRVAAETMQESQEPARLPASALEDESQTSEAPLSETPADNEAAQASQLEKPPEASDAAGAFSPTEDEPAEATADEETPAASQALPLPAAASEDPLPALPRSLPQEKAPVEDHPPAKSPKFVWVWAGTHVSMQRLRESLSGGTNSSFRSLRGPGIFFRAGFSAGEGGLDFSYEKMPGQVSSPSTATVEGGTYHWSAVRGRAFLQVAPGWRIKGGVDQDRTPLLYPDSDSGKIYVRGLSVFSGALGLEWAQRVSDRGRLELGVTYQRPISASTLDRATVDLKPKPGGQVSFGYVHAIGNSLRLGAYLQCDRQDFSFSYRDSPSAVTTQGTQTLGSQSLGLRLGWEY